MTTEKYKIWDNQQQEWFRPEYPGTKTDLKSGKMKNVTVTREIMFSQAGEMYLHQIEDGVMTLTHIINPPDPDACRFIPCLYTGTKDLHDLKTYLNDVVRIGKQEAVIIFKNGSFMADAVNVPESIPVPLADVVYEVIGNILEHRAKLEKAANQAS